MSEHPLQAYRSCHGLSRAALATKLGVTEPTVWRWEEGSRKISRELLPSVVQATGIPARRLRPDLFELLGIEAAE
jgi:transcriptional regulator with XRE-family HTH domain